MRYQSIKQSVRAGIHHVMASCAGRDGQLQGSVLRQRRGPGSTGAAIMPGPAGGEEGSDGGPPPRNAMLVVLGALAGAVDTPELATAATPDVRRAQQVRTPSLPRRSAPFHLCVEPFPGVTVGPPLST